MPEGLLLRDAANLVEPGILRFLLQARQQFGRLVIVDLLASEIGIGTEAKSPVVDEASTAKSLC